MAFNHYIFEGAMKFLSSAFASMLVRISDWFSMKFNDNYNASKPTEPDVKREYIECLLDAVNSSSEQVRNIYITFLLAGIYIAIIIWSTTDMMLLKNTPVHLPLLNAELPITGFYTFTPYFFLLLHFNLLLQLYLLSDKLHRFDHAVSSIEDQIAQKHFYTRLFPFAFSHTLSGRQHSGFMTFVLTTMVWITIIWLPLCLLISLQVGFLAYHSEQVLNFQRWAIAIDLLLLTIFWPIIRTPDGNGITWFMRATGLSSLLTRIARRLSANTAAKQSETNKSLMRRNNGQPMIEGALSLITLVVVISFSWGIAVLPDSNNESRISRWISDASQWFGEQVYVSERQYAENKNEDNPVKLRKTPEWIAALAESSAEFFNSLLSDKPLGDGGHRYFLLTELLFDRTYQKDYSGKKQPRESIFHRNLRLREKLLIANELKPEDEAILADANNKVPQAVMRKIVGLNLRARDLRYADFTESLMPKVDFRKVNEVVTNLRNAQFTRATIFQARMSQADLQSAILEETKLQGAILKKANLIGANLTGINLQGADLSYALLLGANLEPSRLNSKNSVASQLQGSTLYMANLQGAHLSKAQLQGADMRFVILHGAKLVNTDLQGVDLSGAEFQGADLTSATLTLSNINFAKFDQISQNEYVNSYIDVIDLIEKQELSEKIGRRIFQATQHSVILTNAVGKDIFGWVDVIELQAFKEPEGNYLDSYKTRYQNSLKDFLIKISCKNKSVASGVIRYRGEEDMIIQSNFAHCLLLLKDKIDKTGQLVCPGVSKISEMDTEKLKKMQQDNKFEAQIKGIIPTGC